MCVCVELVFLSLFLFEVIAVSIMLAERGSETGEREERRVGDGERRESRSAA